MSTLGERIKYIRSNILKANQAAFAKSLDFARVATISDYEKDKRSPDITTLRKIVDLSGVTLEWLLTGNGDIFPYEATRKLEAQEVREGIYSDDFVETKVYDMSAAGDPKNFPGTGSIDVIHIPRRDYERGPVAIRVRGESMSPNILNGATVGVDTKDRCLVSGDLYAVWQDFEGVTVKRVFVYTDRVVLKPDNPTFPQTSIYKEKLDGGFILGKIVWLFQRY